MLKVPCRGILRALSKMEHLRWNFLRKWLPSDHLLYIINNKNTRMTSMTPSGVFIVNFEHISVFSV